MRKILLSTFLVFSFCFSFSQNKQIDSLLNLLKTDKEDTNKVNHLNALGWVLDGSNPDTAILLDKQALALAEKQQWKLGMANSLDQLGTHNWRKSNYPTALDYSLRALKIDEEINNKKGIATQLGNIGIVYYSQADYPKALNYYLRALKIYEELRDKSRIANNLGNIGVIYYDQTEYSKALEYHFKALKINEELGDKPGLTNNFGNIGNVYIDQADSAKEKGNEVVATDKYNKALTYYLKALDIAQACGNKNSIAIWLGNIGGLYTQTGKYVEAEKYLLDALQIDKEIGAQDGETYREEALSHLYEKTGRTELALIHYKKFTQLKDTLFGTENKKQLLEKQMQYEFDKKETELKAKAELEKTITEAKHKQKQLIYISVIILITIMAFFMLNRQQLKSKQYKIIFEKQEALFQAEKQKAEDELLHAKKLLDNYTENLIDKNKAIEELQFEMEKLKGLKAAELYKEKIDNLDDLNNATILTNEDWEKFKELFEQVYKGFFTRLKDKLPNLTNAETRLVTLIKLNLDAKQMANMLGVSPNTITVTKYRLRKKINLGDNQDIDLLVKSI